MSHSHETSGTIWAVFGHRFAIEGPDGRVLADLGPKGAEGLTLARGDAVTVRGEKKPSEIKVATLLHGGTTHDISWPEKHRPGDKDHRPADPTAALTSVRAAGYAVQGEVARKPKHFEIRGMKGGSVFALHVALDGEIRKTTLIESGASIG